MERVLLELNCHHKSWLFLALPLDRCYLMGLFWSDFDNSPGNYGMGDGAKNFLPPRIRELAHEYVPNFEESDEYYDSDHTFYSNMPSDTTLDDDLDTSNEVGTKSGFVLHQASETDKDESDGGVETDYDIEDNECHLGRNKSDSSSDSDQELMEAGYTHDTSSDSDQELMEKESGYGSVRLGEINRKMAMECHVVISAGDKDAADGKLQGSP